MTALKLVCELSDQGLITSPKTVLYLDDEPIGVIQEINFNIKADDHVGHMEITFPDLHSEKIDATYANSSFVKEVDARIEQLKAFPGIIIKLKELFF